MKKKKRDLEIRLGFGKKKIFFFFFFAIFPHPLPPFVNTISFFFFLDHTIVIISIIISTSRILDLEITGIEIYKY